MSDGSPAEASTPETAGKPSTWVSLARSVRRFDADKIAPWIALRNTIGVIVPLAAAVALGRASSGLLPTTGALNVSFSDGSDPYLQRAERMVAATLLGGFAVFIGGLAGGYEPADFAITAAWAFAAGLLVALDASAADIGLISLVTYLIFSAHPMAPADAAASGLLALGGGFVQTALALALWPLKRYEPERRVLGSLYLELSRIADSPVSAVQAPPATTQITAARQSLARLGHTRTIQGERYLSLLSQAERIRLSLLTLSRVRTRLLRQEDTAQYGRILDGCFEATTRILSSTGESLSAGAPANPSPELLQELHRAAETFRNALEANESQGKSAMLFDAVSQLDGLAGQLRSAIDLAVYSTSSGRAAFERRESGRPWYLRLGGTFATLRANLNLESAALRHAVRLSASVALGDLVARAMAGPRSYWLPMTVALVLKPDFTTTFTRGVLRLAGTFVGLIVATALFHLLSPAIPADVLLIAVFAFLLRCFGPANYGITAIAISALVVLLFAVTGVAPREVIAERGSNTALGGLIALAMYAVWPTWERHQVAETMAGMLDAYRDYFRTIKEGYLLHGDSLAHELDQSRIAARLARSNLEASVDRFNAEPGVSAESVRLLNAMLPSSHRLVHAMMALEAGLSASRPVPARPAFRVFANDVELTLHSLSAALRGSSLSLDELPDLREDHERLIHSGDALTERYALVNVESDRITNSLNTFARQILQWIAARTGSGVTDDADASRAAEPR